MGGVVPIGTSYRIDARSLLMQGVASTPVDDFTDATLWSFASGTTGTLGTTTDPKATAASVMTVTTPTTNHSALLRDYNFDGRNKFLTVRIKADANTRIIQPVIVMNGRTYSSQFFMDGGLKPITGVFGPLRVGEWSEITLSMADFTSAAEYAAKSVGASSPASSSIKDVRQIGFEVYPVNGTATTVGFSQLMLHDNPLEPGVIWSFDDARGDTYTTAFPILRDNGYVGQIYVATAGVGGTITDAVTVPACSLAQLLEMKSEGWVMGGHSHAHNDLTALSAANLAIDLDTCYDYLIDNALIDGGGAHFAYPYSGVNEAVLKATLQRFRTARTTAYRVGTNPKYATRGLMAGVAFQTAGGADKAANAAQAKWYMDRVAQRGGVLLWILHTVGNADVGTNIPTADFTEAVEYAASIGLRSYTLDDLYPN